MALSKEQIDILADNYIVSLFSGMEQEVINDIARRINKTGRYTETAEIQARNMRELGFSTLDIQTSVLKQLNADDEYKKEIAINTREYKKNIKDIISELVYEAKFNGQDMIAKAGDMSWNDDLQMWSAHNIDLKKDSTLKQLRDAFIKQTNGDLRNITRTTAFVGTPFGTTGVLNAYQRAMDMAVLKTCTGTFSYNQAVVDVIRDLSHGLASIDYANGRKYHIDTAARMVARTSCSQLAGKVTEHNIEKTGVELVYVDAHAGARPSHAEWQGQVFAYKGKSSKYDDFVSATDYGSVTGLKGINCTHNFYPYWEGDPIHKFKEPDPVNVDGKDYSYYDATQKQRRMERGIRDTKREIKALESLNDPNKAAAIKEAKERLNNQRQKYVEFSNKAGIEPQASKLRLYDQSIISSNKRSIKIGDNNVKFMHKVDKTNVSESQINQIKSSIAYYSQKYNIKLDAIELGNYNSEEDMDSPMFYIPYYEGDSYRGKLVINNSCIFWKSTATQLLTFIDAEIKAQNLDEMVLHEMIHVKTFQNCKNEDDYNKRDKIVRSCKGSGISQYAINMKDGAEDLAEGVVALNRGENIPKKLRSQIKRLLDI